MAALDAFFTTLRQKIHVKTQYNANNRQCSIWTGAKTSDGRYGRLVVTFPDHSRKDMRVTRLLYMMKHETLQIPTHDIENRRLEMSHLCHESLCINTDHLILESHTINMEREHCANQGFCAKSHHPHCIF